MIWIIAIIIALLGWWVYKLISEPVDNIYRLSEATTDTPLKEFKESHETANIFEAIKFDDIENISAMYEEMCILHPLKYKGDPRVEDVLANYERLLRGEIIDIDGKHVPSEEIDGQKNEDYERYLQAQQKACAVANLSKNSRWANDELKRLKEISIDEDLMTDFLVTLVDAGLPNNLIDAALQEEKMNTFDEEDWQRFIHAAKEYDRDNPDDSSVIESFIRNFHSIDILCDTNKFDIFKIYYKYDAPIEVVKPIIEDKISPRQAELIVTEVTIYGTPWNEAMSQVLRQDLEKEKELQLRLSYKRRIERRL